LSVREIVPELTYEDFQGEVYEDSDIFFQSNEESVLDQLCTYYIPLYFVELELHATSKLARAPMLGLTRII
jgi:hypothetical protein